MSVCDLNTSLKINPDPRANSKARGTITHRKMEGKCPPPPGPCSQQVLQVPFLLLWLLNMLLVYFVLGAGSIPFQFNPTIKFNGVELNLMGLNGFHFIVC